MISNTFKVGTFKCEMTISALGQIEAVWNPRIPKHLTPEEMAQYRAARDALAAEFTKTTGIDFLIVET